VTLRQRLVVTVALVSLLSAVVFSGTLLYLVRATLSFGESRAVARGLEVAVASAQNPADKAEALQAFRAYHQLQAVRGLIEQRVVIAGLLFGLLVFLVSLGIGFVVMMRLTRPLKELTAALNRLGTGDLTVKVNAATQSEVGRVAEAFNAMTERLRVLQEELRRSERLAAWRDVARVLAHEVRNPLTPIRLSVERLQDKAARQSPDLAEVIVKSSRTVLEEIDALDRIVREFSEFARLPEPKRKPTELNRLITDVVAQYSAAAPGVRFETVLDPAVAEWSLDPDLMRRVFGNIVKNSIEALTESQAGAAGRVVIRTSRLEGGCKITFSDSGPGIPPEVRARAFEPYFTTKPKGTGLGLAVARNIVVEHGGTIDIDSTENGTTIVIILPRQDAT